MTKGDDFLLVESADRRFFNPMYRTMMITGCTFDTNGLLKMATMMKHNHEGAGTEEITSIEEAVVIVEKGGWVVLEFLN